MSNEAENWLFKYMVYLLLGVLIILSLFIISYVEKTAKKVDAIERNLDILTAVENARK